MSEVFVTSDSHFGHDNFYNFIDDNGIKIRPFVSAYEADNYMVDAWNKLVREEDKVYHLGDVAFSNRHLARMACLNGRKILIKGNHDTLKARKYLEYFKDIRATHVLDRVILSHVPIYKEGLFRFTLNAHGHTHNTFVLDADKKPDERYVNCCVEVNNYCPIPLDDILDKARRLRGEC